MVLFLVFMLNVVRIDLVYVTTNPAEADIKFYFTGNATEAKGK